MQEPVNTGTTYEKMRRSGPRVVAVGGGTGLSGMLRGLKQFTENITAVVTVADDGGSSGMLRDDLGILPPGDIRNCILALSDTEPIMRSLFNYRFSDGMLAGHNMGNLVLAALNDICGSFNGAVTTMGEVLAMTGRVLPVTLEDVRLEAEFENGVRAVGESTILEHKKQQGCRVRRVRLIPEGARAQFDVTSALEQADMIVFGPGSLYTSIIPNLLVDGVVEAVRRSEALKVYVCNVMTQEGESEGYTVADHISELFKHAYDGLFSLCLANDAPVSPALLARYETEGAEPTPLDRERVKKLGVELVTGDILSEKNGVVRHDSDKLALALMELYADRRETRRA